MQEQTVLTTEAALDSSLEKLRRRIGFEAFLLFMFAVGQVDTVVEAVTVTVGCGGAAVVVLRTVTVFPPAATVTGAAETQR